ncbi:MAG: helix-turn-helix domain-containing protein [Ruminococcaceae bacterium]|nr:helix-turn-helix domain-containing protein [Oscillospiraceae bacterium]
MEAKLLRAEKFVDMNTEISYRYVYSDTEYFRYHYHDYFEIFLILDGSVMHIVNGAEIRLGKGSLVLIRPDDCHNYRLDNEKQFSMLNITFTADTANSLFLYLDNGFPKENLLNSSLPPEAHLDSFEFERVCKRMNVIRAADPKDLAGIKTSLRIFLFDIFVRYFSDEISTYEKIPLWLEEMCSKVKKNCRFSLGSEYFFSLSNKSREHISRTMKKYTGMTVTEYINTLRLNYIANMLRNSNHSISDIIYDSGFNNISWASELFKGKYGVTMRDYRQSIKK